MATWYAQLSADSFFSVSGGTTSDMWNSAANGSGSWLDLSTNYAADTFNSNGKTTIALDADVTAATLTSSGGAGTWLINTDAVTITANLVAGTVATFLMNSGGSGGTTPHVTITGNLTAGSSSNDVCVSITTPGKLTVNGNVLGGSAGAAYGISGTTGCTGAVVTVNGNVTGGTHVNGYGINNDSAAFGSVTVNNGTIAADAAPAILLGSGVACTLAIHNCNIVDTSTVNAILLRWLGMTYDPHVANYYDMRGTSGLIRMYFDVPAYDAILTSDQLAGLDGHYHAPDAAEVISTANFGPESGTAGTFDEAARNTDPGESNVKSGTSYKIQNVSKNGSYSAGGSGGVFLTKQIGIGV